MGGLMNRRRMGRGPVVVGLAVIGLGMAGLAALGAGRPAGALKPEYARVVALVGTLQSAELNGCDRLVFTTADRQWQAVLLENQVAAALQDAVDKAVQPQVVTVTGVVTEYRGQNYLLLTAAETAAAPRRLPD